MTPNVRAGATHDTFGQEQVAQARLVGKSFYLTIGRVICLKRRTEGALLTGGETEGSNLGCERFDVFVCVFHGPQTKKRPGRCTL
jgi:hypothetical protein